MPVHNLPPETLDQIVGHVGEHTDVLNVALTNKTLASVANTSHLHFRDIRSRLNNPALWAYLSRPDDLRAAHIRSLTIVTNDSVWDMYELVPVEQEYDLRERLPPGLGESIADSIHELTREQCQEHETQLVSALRRMTNLERFRWYRVPRPMLEGPDDIWTTLQRLGTVKELDIADLDNGSNLQGSHIASSETFLTLSGFTTLKIRTTICRLSQDAKIPQLETMLLGNCPALEVLVLELDLNEDVDGTASISRLLREASWPNLRVFKVPRGAKCKVADLQRFLTAHPGIEELALSRMMTGRSWAKLDLPEGSLPNLRVLECSTAQATALLNASSKIESLRGVEVHEKVKDSQFYSWDDEWHDDHPDEDEPNEEEEKPSPWRALFLERLASQRSVTHLGITSIDSVQEMEALAAAAPQLKELIIEQREEEVTDADWYRAYSLFSELEIIQTGFLVWFETMHNVTDESIAKANTHIQTLARACPKLKVIFIAPRARKAVIIRETGKKGRNSDKVKWVVREWEESEEAVVKEKDIVRGI